MYYLNTRTPIPIFKLYVINTINVRGGKNTGIKAAQGQYIAFADQDDIVISENVKEALDFSVDSGVDMLACRYCVQYTDNSIKEFGVDSVDGIIVSNLEFCEQYFSPGVSLAPWSYLYRRDFLINTAHPYEEDVVMEDSDWIAWHLIHANTIGYYKHPIYTWVMNLGSITHSSHYVNKADWIKMGYRKIRDANLYLKTSSVFSDIMLRDGKENIRGGFMKLWKVDHYHQFYQHLGDVLYKLQEMTWKQPVKFLIDHSIASCVILGVIGPVLKTVNGIRLFLLNYGK